MAYGRRKDRRPDLKPFKMGMMTTSAKIPFYIEPLSGKKADPVWNREALEKVAELVSPETLRGMTYGIDAALVCAENLKVLHELHQKDLFLSLACRRRLA